MKVRLKHLMGYSIDNKIGDVVEAIFEENQYRCLCNWGGITGWLFFTNYAVELIEESDGLTWEKVKEDFESQYAITKSKAFKLDQHYNNENGSLYLFAQQHELNAWEFDILKRIVRCRKKGQFKEDLEKTKRVIDLYLKEFEA